MMNAISEERDETLVLPVIRLAKPYFSIRNRAARFCWGFVSFFLFRPTLRPLHAWRGLLLRAFGARLGKRCHIYPGARIWAPWNLECGDDVAIADETEIYNTSLIKLEDGVVISQGAYLCGASHDPDDPSFPLVSAPILVERQAWVASRAIVMFGITLGEGCVIGAGSVVTKNMPKGAICGGNPCRVIRMKGTRKEIVGKSLEIDAEAAEPSSQRMPQ
jgi:putative colanic acid biosynthesis acetyltransferase WcaF